MAQRAFSWRSVGRGVAVRGMGPMLYRAGDGEQVAERAVMPAA